MNTRGLHHIATRLFPLLLLPATAQAGLQGQPRFDVERGPFPMLGDVAAWGFADWDGDGDLDGLTVGPNEGPFELLLTLLENDGHGSFEAHVLADLSGHLPGNREIVGVLPGDLDGDGDLDAVLPIDPANTTPLLALLREGSAWEVVPYDQHLFGSVLGAGLGDLDGDGDLDALLSLTTGFHGLHNDGSGRFVAAPTDLPFVIYFEEFALADLDGDGAADLIASAGDLTVFLNGGSGAFLPGVSLATGGRQIDVGDVDGDGDVDLLAAVESELQSPQAVLFLNDGEGDFTPAPDLAFLRSFQGESGLALKDHDVDGDLDVVWPGSVAFNDGLGNFATPVESFVAGLLPADLDSDGDADWIAPEGVFLGNGRGAAIASFESAFPGARSPLGDVDGDGDPDTVRNVNGVVRVMLNDGRGVFTPGAVVPFLDVYSSNQPAMDLGDLDGDGDRDLYAYWVDEQRMLNDGTGVFTKHGSCALIPFDVAVNGGVLADFDGDSDLDAFATTRTIVGGSYDQLRLNDGSGCLSLAPEGYLPLRKTQAYNAAVSDLDLDGDLDIVTPDGIYFRNDGTGQFVDASGDVGSKDAGEWVSAGDLDGDGWSDLLFSGSLYNQVLWNDGAGAFPGAPTVGPGVKRTELADFDGDDLLDAATFVSSSDGRLIVYRNLGDGTAFEPLPVLHNTGGEPTLGDLDLDGDVDILSGTRALLNGTRALAWQSFPRVGHPLRMKVGGLPGDPFRLFATRGLLAQPEPTRVGLLHIALNGSAPSWGGTIGNDGTTVLSFPVPHHPALVGVTVYWQALVGSPARWSNFERTDLLAF